MNRSIQLNLALSSELSIINISYQHQEIIQVLNFKTSYKKRPKNHPKIDAECYVLWQNYSLSPIVPSTRLDQMYYCIFLIPSFILHNRFRWWYTLYSVPGYNIMEDRHKSIFLQIISIPNDENLLMLEVCNEIY